ncbi:M28 family metallopeptidase [Spongiimicrobium salis]|uniref:M28 family metallopeptidase n=1 Tax=Spongiimicrobium salis TaxID=1667022 RepID=UPI00374CFF02
MKQITLFAIALLMGCGGTKVKEKNATGPIGGPEGLKARIASSEAATLTDNEGITYINHSNSDKIGAIMEFLASDELQGRDSGSEGIAKAASYIETIFKENGISPYFESYKDTLSNFEPTAYNVVGVLEGNDPVLKNEYVVIGAHYDHIGRINPENGDAIANGANDNASGTTTVLELARYFGNAKVNKRSLVFALFSAEEKGLLGSKHLAKKLKAGNMNLYAMLNYEMVGVPLADKDYLMYVTGYENSNLAEVSNTYAKGKLIGFLPTAKKFGLFQRSDNYPFHQEFGVPSQTYCTFDFTNFNHYHKVGDENELMDFGHMAEVVNKSIPMITGISNAATQEIKYQ